MIQEIARLVHPSPKGNRFVAVLAFKFDESYGPRTLVVGGWIAEEVTWNRVGRIIQDSVDFENSTLPREKRISRYHAAEMNAYSKEFVGWKDEKHRIPRMTKKMFSAVSDGDMIAVSCGIDLNAFEAVFPGAGKPNAYALCMKKVMVEIALGMKEHRPLDRVMLIHDHGSWDLEALQAYNAMVDDPEWEDAWRFVSISPLRWQDDAGLQAADMIAYESFKMINSNVCAGGGAELRKAMKELLKMNDGVYAEHLNVEGLQILRNEAEKGSALAPGG